MVDRPHQPVAVSKHDDQVQELVRQTVNGSSEAAQELLAKVAPTIRAVVGRYLGPGHRETEDWIQESLIAFVQALPRFREESSIQHYARRICLHRLLDRQKRATAQKRALDDHVGDDPEVAPASPRQLHDLETNRLRPLFQRLLAELPTEQAEAFAARHVLGYSVAEIGISHEVSPNTVRSRLRLAKEALLRRIDADPQLALLLERSL